MLKYGGGSDIWRKEVRKKRPWAHLGRVGQCSLESEEQRTPGLKGQRSCLKASCSDALEAGISKGWGEDWGHLQWFWRGKGILGQSDHGEQRCRTWKDTSSSKNHYLGMAVKSKDRGGRWWQRRPETVVGPWEKASNAPPNKGLDIIVIIGYRECGRF